MSDAHTIDGRATLESLRLTPYHLLVFFIMLLVQLVGGICQQNLPYVAPAIARELSLQPWALGTLFGISAVGSAIGAPLAGIIGDIVGPKRTIIASVLGCGLATVAASGVNTLTELGVLRFLVG